MLSINDFQRNQFASAGLFRFRPNTIPVVREGMIMFDLFFGRVVGKRRIRALKQKEREKTVIRQISQRKISIIFFSQ